MFLEETPVFMLVVPFFLFLGSAYLAARLTAETCDFKKSVKIYVPVAALVVLVFAILGLPLVLAVLMGFSGFVALVFFSNMIFYER